MAWVTDVLATAVRTLWSDPVVLVGTSLGGWFALETALQHPDIACGLLLLDSAGLHTPTSYLFRLFLDGQGQGGHDGLIGPLMAAHEAPDEPPMVAAYTTTMTAAALHSWNAHVPDPSLLVRATALDLPTRILWGAKDALIPVSHGRALTDAIRGAELFVIPDAGHLLAIDAPEEVMGRLTGMPLRSGPTCPSMNTD
jgi:pimeloyl-ACP methyl ester carboxylesterase